MTGRDHGRGGTLLMPFEAYGVRLLLTTDSPDLYERLPRVLPPGATACSANGAKHTLALNVGRGGSFVVSVNDRPFLDGLSLEMALDGNPESAAASRRDRCTRPGIRARRSYWHRRRRNRHTRPKLQRQNHARRRIRHGRRDLLLG